MSIWTRLLPESATLAFVRSGLVVVIALGVLVVAAPASAATVAHFKLVFWRDGRVAADPLKSNEMAPASTHNDCKEVR
jgi:hypothetical protein